MSTKSIDINKHRYPSEKKMCMRHHWTSFACVFVVAMNLLNKILLFIHSLDEYDSQQNLIIMRFWETVTTYTIRRMFSWMAEWRIQFRRLKSSIFIANRNIHKNIFCLSCMADLEYSKNFKLDTFDFDVAMNCEFVCIIFVASLSLLL